MPKCRPKFFFISPSPHVLNAMLLHHSPISCNIIWTTRDSKIIAWISHLLDVLCLHKILTVSAMLTSTFLNTQYQNAQFGKTIVSKIPKMSTTLNCLTSILAYPGSFTFVWGMLERECAIPCLIRVKHFNVPCLEFISAS